MSQHAETRQKSRRSGSSNWLPGGLLIAVACAVGFYFVQNPAAFEQARDGLGFGRVNAQPEQAADSSTATKVVKVDAREALQIPRTEELGANSERFAAVDTEESAAASFLPRNRSRRHSAGQQQDFAGAADENVQLDQRFEQEPSEPPTSRVLTAELVEAAEESAEEVISRPATSREPSRSKYPGINSRTQSPDSPQSENRQSAAANSVHLTAGDDAPPAPASRRPGRPTVKASPAASNSGIKQLDLTEVRRLIEDGQDAEAYHKLSEAYFQFPSQRPQFQKPLDDVSQRIYFSSQTQIQPPYEIQSGDQLRKIANKYQLSWQYLSRLNQVDARKIRPGKLLKVFQGPFEAKVDLSDYELTIMLNGMYVKRYQVGIGKTNSTPIGEFTVREKLENPTYYGPNGMVLEPDDPQNPLGERWIDIGNSFGIHGTIEPDSIGKSESAGCIRMRNEEVAEVYDLLIVGSQVRIQR